jgi:DNA processing protein
VTIYGIPEAHTLTAAAVGRELDKAEAREYFARAAWTSLAEPGDRLANVVVRQLGADAAFAALVDKWDAARFVSALDGIATSDDLNQAIERWMPRLESAAIVRALKQAVRFGARLLAPGDELWPSMLNDLGDNAPLALWARGTDAALASFDRSIALVGARAATGYGEHVTMEASAGLVDRGYTIVSGAAYGIDGMAHRAALASNGLTVAFLAGGVDRFYPSGHDALLTRIVETGAVIAELPCGASPTKWRFLQRNRLIAAVSQATIVLEAGWRSGSLNTAGHASQIGRPLGAVPGPITSAASAGCHRLIRDYNAVLVTSPDEMAELAPLGEIAAHAAADVETVRVADVAPEPEPAAPVTTPRTDDRTRLLDAVSDRSPRASKDIAKRAGFSVVEAQALLGVLELEGVVEERERGWVRPRPKKERGLL